MKYFRCFSAATTFWCGLFHPCLAQDAIRTLEPLYVRAGSLTKSLQPGETLVGAESLRGTDAAALVRHLPGAAIVRNGPQTGILQLRGLSGDRVAVRVDGMTITPACPNHMDPPLHYAGPAGGDLIEWFAGISPVSTGGDHIGGAMSIRSAAPLFADGDGILTNGTLGVSFLGSQDALVSNSGLTVASGNGSLQYRGYGANADDLRYPGGRVSASGYEIMRHGLTGAWRTAGGYIAVDAGFSATRDSGTPALPMDMIKDDAWRFGFTHQESYGWGSVENRFYVHDIDHLMDNDSLRPVAGMAMESPSSSRDLGWRGDVTLPRGEYLLRVGVDLHRNEFDAEQVARDSGLRRDTFADNRRGRVGAYAEWERRYSSQWVSRLGIRSDVVFSDADKVGNEIMNMGAIMSDMEIFNRADRSFTDVMVDATAALRFTPDERTGIELAVAMKNRAPSLVERYLWTPLNASAGLADGRTYLGNLDLDPETSFQVALEFTRKGDKWHSGVTPFYQSVSDYIQGMPISRMSAGKPVLQYQNIDRVELYGFETSGGYDAGNGFTLDASVSHVRGRNRESGGDLYRIAPLRGMFDLGYEHDKWENHLEWVWAAAQNRVSEMQDEQPSPGYGILNLRVARTFASALRVELGVENLLDKRYADHLGGVNRVGGGDLDIGERIPGAGRFAYASASLAF